MPCQNGGECKNELNQFTCHCRDGQTTVQCDAGISLKACHIYLVAICPMWQVFHFFQKETLSAVSDRELKAVVNYQNTTDQWAPKFKVKYALLIFLTNYANAANVLLT